MPKAKQQLAFIDAKQLRELAERALDVFSRADELWREPPDDETQEEAHLAWRASREAVRFCSAAIAQLRDPSLWDLAVRIAEEAGGSLAEHRYQDPDGTDGISGLIEQGIGQKELQYCAAHDWAPVRLAVASSVPADAQGAATLRQLCEDLDPGVRKTASERLAEIDEVPWWAGRFSFDPFEGMTAEEAERCKPAVIQLGEALTSEYVLEEHLLAALRSAAQVPARVGCEAVKRFAMAGVICRYGRVDEQTTRAASILVEAGDLGLQTIASLFDAPTRHAYVLTGPYLKALPEERRLAALRLLLQLLEERIHGEGEFDTPEYALATAIGGSWPDDADPRPVLELALARGEREYDLVASSLGDALGRTRRLELIQQRLIAAHLQGYGGAWQTFRHDCEQALRRLPEAELEDLVKRSLASGVESAVEWGIRCRLDAAEAKQDGKAPQLALALDDAPALRPVMRGHFASKLIPRLRKELVEGKLDHPIALEVMEYLGQHWGGTVLLASARWIHLKGEPESPKTTPPEPSDLPYLPEATRCPPSSEELEAYRRARASWGFQETREYFRALRVIPSARPWHPSDRAFFEKALAHLEAEFDDWLVIQAGWVLYTLGEAADLPTFERLEKLAGTEPNARRSILSMRREFRARLGLPELAQAADEEAEDDDDDGWGDEAS